MTNIHALHRQAEWEVESTRRALLRYREASLSKAPHELPSGRLLLRSCVPPLAAAIRLGQHEALAGLPSDGRTPLWAWPLLAVDAEEAAVIALCTTLRSIAALADGVPQGGLATCLMIARVCQEQLGFTAWVEEQAKINRLAKKEKKDGRGPGNQTHGGPDIRGSEADHERGAGPGGGSQAGHIAVEPRPPEAPRVDLLAALRARHPDVDRRTWAKWRRKLGLTRTAPWDKAVSLAFGGWLLEALARTSGGRFSVGHRAVGGGRMETFVSLDRETEELLRDTESRAEVARPLRLPMLIPPIPWAYEEK